MKLIDIANPDAPPIHLPWDAAQQALAGGGYDAHPPEGERGPDQPAAQSPAPGTDPYDATLVQTSAGGIPNMTRAVIPATIP